MTTFLAVVGGLVVGLLVLVVGGFIGLRLWLRWKLGKLGLRMADAGHQPVVPRITLVACGPDGIADHAEARGHIAAFEAAGWRPAGTWRIPRMHDMGLWAARSPSGEDWAVVYVHPALPAFWDLVRAWAPEGRGFTLGTGPFHDPANVPPGSGMDWRPGLDVAAGLAAWAALAPGLAPARVVAPEDFAGLVERHYAEQMDHILARGGPDEAEIERVIAQGGGPGRVDEAQRAEARERIRADRLLALEEAIEDHLLREGGISALDWQRSDGQRVLVHALHRPEEVLALFGAVGGTPVAVMPGDDMPAYFAAINQTLEAGQRFRRLGATRRPVAAEAWVEPG